MLLESFRGTYELPSLESRQEKLCRPAKGRSLGATVLEAREPIDGATQYLISGFRREAEDETVLSYLRSRELQSAVSEPAAERLAWFAVNVCLANAVAHRSTRTAPLVESTRWFFDGNQRFGDSLLAAFSPHAIDEADRSLARLVLDADFIDLLPYVLEPLGHVTRSRLERELSALAKREKKRQSGVYYTPSDVAEFMVKEIGDGTDGAARWIDPACGTAVFLREILRHRLESCQEEVPVRYCQASIYGLDISAIATESAAFVLLMECARKQDIATPSAFENWQRISNNIRSCDSTLVDASPRSTRPLLQGGDRAVNLLELFPETEGRFDRLVMNPPYSDIRVTEVRRSLWHSLSGLGNEQKANAAAVFVEMMWKLMRPCGSASAVLPLSIGISSHSEYKACRAAIQKSSGTWEFLFFDREPHALFGEDIKTRNTVAFHHGAGRSVILTSRLLKWTSSMRPMIFTRQRTTAIPGRRDITAFIPKLGSDTEAQLYALLDGSRVARQKPHIGRVALSKVGMLDPENSVVVGASAYNFLNVYLPSALEGVDDRDFSESPLHALVFSSARHRDCGFAILISALAYWLWHVESDGFHVTAGFLGRLPLWLARAHEHASRLGELGRAAWKEARRSRVRSVNGGKATYSFHCPFDSPIVKEIDALLLSSLDLSASYQAEIERFVSATTSINGVKRRKLH